MLKLINVKERTNNTPNCLIRHRLMPFLLVVPLAAMDIVISIKSIILSLNTKCNLKCFPEVFKAISDSLNPTEDKTTVLQRLKNLV